MIPVALLLINSFFLFLKLIVFIACFLKKSKKFLIQPLPVYTSCLFSLFLNEDIVDIEKPNEICSLTFAVNKFSGLFLDSSVFAIINSRPA